MNRLFTLLGPALAVSVIIHAVILFGLFMWKMADQIIPARLMVESVFEEERDTEEFTQEMSIDTTVSDSLSATSGGMVTGNIGAASSKPMAMQNVLESKAMQNPTVNITKLASITMSGAGDVAVDLGEGQVSGEVGARVEGYGAAMHRLTQEIRRMMRQEQVLVVWLFDASISLKDDRDEIRDNFHKIYEELDIARQQAETKKAKHGHLETVIAAFGKTITYITPKPTSDLKEIQEAIDKVHDDPSGEENTYQSILDVIDRYGKLANSSKRKLVIVMMTDETGIDPQALEDTVAKTKLYKSPVFFLGREAIFGYPYARLRWQNPETKVTYPVNVDRGPETAMPEALQWTGFGGRWDSASSGFAPYAQARLVKESGGIFFMLQSEEKDLAGSAARLERKFDDIRMKQYEPDLDSERDYVSVRDKSDFRRTIWNVIKTLNPHLDRELNIADHYPIEPDGFRETAAQQFQRGLRASQMTKSAIETLEKLRPQRDLEPQARWRAAYDLSYAQLLAYQVRIFQYLLAADNHAKNPPLPKDPKSNRWDRTYASKLIEPTPEQIKATGVDVKELEEARKKALAMYDYIIEQHPGTPWAQRAGQEKTWGFGMQFVDRFYDPKYFDPKEIAKIPKF
ncbi:MAG: vWA domain-containing protein [Planctomycetaceae bacterium]